MEEEKAEAGGGGAREVESRWLRFVHPGVTPGGITLFHERGRERVCSCLAKDWGC